MSLIDRLPRDIDPATVPLLGTLSRAGADDRVIDGLMTCGPIIILLIVLFGRTVGTIALAVVYIVLFTVYVLYKGSEGETHRFLR